MTGSPSDAGEIAAQVHTHGTRLVRLAHLLGLGSPTSAAADGLAAALLHSSGRVDSHESLLTAARAVGARSVPPIRDDARLQGWLDRAELDAYDVDLGSLLTSTRQALQVQRAALRRRRLQTAAGAATVILAVAAGALWPDAATVQADRQVRGSGILHPNNPYLNGGDPHAVPAAARPAPRQRLARHLPLAGVVLSGRTTPIMATSLPAGPATLLAVTCTAAHRHATCVLLAPVGVSLFDLDAEAVVALLPHPERDAVLSQLLPTVLRGSMIGTLASQTLLLDVTSPEVATALVTYTDGSQVQASRYLPPGQSTPLFVARNKDVMPASVAYLDRRGHPLGRRSLYTAAS